MEDLLHSQALSVFIGMVLTAIGGYVVVLLNNKKLVSERLMTTQALAMERETRQADLEAQLKMVRLEGEIADAKRQQAALLEAEKLRRETQEAQKVIADALAKKSADDLQAMEAQNKVLAEIHGLTNSSKAALELVEQNLRAELRATEKAAETAAIIAAKDLQTQKDLSARDLAAKEQVIAQLTQQLAQSIPPSAHLSGALTLPPDSPLSVTIPATPELTLPVEESTPEALPASLPRIITP